MGVWGCGGVEVWRCGGVGVWRCGGVEVWDVGIGCARPRPASAQGLSQGNQALARADADSLGAGGGAELGEDRGDVKLDGVLADLEA